MGTAMAATCVLLTLVFQRPFSENQANDFIFVVIGCAIWTFFIGEALSIFTKAWLVWLAAGSSYHSQRGLLAGCAKTVLTYIPCVSSIQLLPTEL